MSDHDLIRVALAMRANYIETGDVNLSAEDALERLRSWMKTRDHRDYGKTGLPVPKGLTDEQKELVARLRFLSREQLKKGRK